MLVLLVLDLCHRRKGEEIQKTKETRVSRGFSVLRQPPATYDGLLWLTYPPCCCKHTLLSIALSMLTVDGCRESLAASYETETRFTRWRPIGLL